MGPRGSAHPRDRVLPARAELRLSCLFAFSSALAWSYYGLKGWTYLFGEGRLRAIVFQMIFCAFIALGCMLELRAVLDFSDAMTFMIALPNILMLYLFAPMVRREVNQYIADTRSAQ